MTTPDRIQFAKYQDLQKRLNEIPRPTIGDMARLGATFSYAGRLSSPFGAWHCPNCWRDYAARGQYSNSAIPSTARVLARSAHDLELPQ